MKIWDKPNNKKLNSRQDIKAKENKMYKFIEIWNKTKQTTRKVFWQDDIKTNQTVEIYGNMGQENC